MKPADRQKLCPNCDGRIPYESTQCPYCFTTLQAENSSNKIFSPPSDTLSALYNPPYSHKTSASEAVEPKMVKSPSPSKETTASLENDSASDTHHFWSILFLVVGGNLLTLGLLQFLFSDHGIIHLEINGSYWFLMVLVSLPLFYLGLKKISRD